MSIRVCRFCDKLTTQGSVKYSTRHYAHFDCFLDSGHTLDELTAWQVGKFPYRLLKARGLLERARQMQKEILACY